MRRDAELPTARGAHRDFPKRRFPSFLTIPRPALKWTEPWGATSRVARKDIGYNFKQGLIYSALLMSLVLVAPFVRGDEDGSRIDARVLLGFLLITLALALLYPAAAFFPGCVRLYSDRWIINRGRVGQAFRLESLRKCVFTTCELDGKEYPVLQGWNRSGQCVFSVFWRDSVSKTELTSTLDEWCVKLQDVR